MTSRPIAMNGDTDAPSALNAGKSPTQHMPLYTLDKSSPPGSPSTRKSNGAMAMFIDWPSTPDTCKPPRLTLSLSGPIPALADAIQFATLKNDPMSTIALNGAAPFNETCTVFNPTGCVVIGILTKSSTSTAPFSTAPRGQNDNFDEEKSNSTTNLPKKSSPSKPPMTGGKPTAVRSVTTASKPSTNSCAPMRTPLSVTFCLSVSPVPVNPRIAAPSMTFSLSMLSIAFGVTSAAVAPVSMTKSHNPTSPPISSAHTAYPALGFPATFPSCLSGTIVARFSIIIHVSAARASKSLFSKQSA
mmetsp:Transcript_5132/g.18641  ORF Transcript_5132/g.18641 Transcript_5132/m.18641 type:complete len:301 (-) Transcript_5132:362-1264(-)